MELRGRVLAVADRGNHSGRLYFRFCLKNSELQVGQGQYRNAVASGRLVNHLSDPTLPRYGTDVFKVRSKLFQSTMSQRKLFAVANDGGTTRD